MRTLKAIAPLAAVMLAAVAWLILSETGSNLISSWIKPWRPIGPEIGRISELEGSFKTVRDGRVREFTQLPQPLPVHSGDRIEVDDGSQVVLILNSQDEIELKSLTAAAVQLWNERDPGSPIYVTILGGETELRKAGVKGKAYLVRDGRLYLPGQKAINKAMALTVLKNAPLEMQLADEGMKENPANTAPDFAPEAGESDQEPAEKDLGAEPETLSNELIDEMIASRQQQLQKCWLTSVKDDMSRKANLIVQFTISRRGKVRDVKIADSSSNDEDLKNCVVTVFERLTFRSFKGPEISLSYPIQFE